MNSEKFPLKKIILRKYILRWAKPFPSLRPLVAYRGVEKILRRLLDLLISNKIQEKFFLPKKLSLILQLYIVLTWGQIN